MLVERGKGGLARAGLVMMMAGSLMISTAPIVAH